VRSCAILTEIPELGHLSGKQAAALAGLAPISKQSGKWRGKERIQGGRASVRRAIYLPAVVAKRFNPDMKAKYEHLVSIGKCKKLAISRHAKVDCHGQRITARSAEMGRISSLTNTDTRRLRRAESTPLA
jgi:transposase